MAMKSSFARTLPSHIYDRDDSLLFGERMRPLSSTELEFHLIEICLGRRSMQRRYLWHRVGHSEVRTIDPGNEQDGICFDNRNGFRLHT